MDIGINEKDRAESAAGLSRLLADSFSLYLKTHNFHWNVKGPMFNTLHVMFMDQYTELWNALDAIAERIRALGFPAPGTFSEFARLTVIHESEGVPKADDMIRQQAVAAAPEPLVVVTDRPSDLPDDIAERYAIGVVPARVDLDGRDYLDKIGLSTGEFYRRMASSRQLHGQYREHLRRRPWLKLPARSPGQGRRARRPARTVRRVVSRHRQLARWPARGGSPAQQTAAGDLKYRI